MSWPPRPPLLAAPSPESRSKSVGCGDGERPGLRRTEQSRPRRLRRPGRGLKPVRSRPNSRTVDRSRSTYLRPLRVLNSGATSLFGC